MRLLYALLLLFISTTFLSGCTSTSKEPQTNGSGEIIQQFPNDDLGRPVNLEKPAQRVVCIGPGATETIFALGAGDKLVGRDQVSDYPQEAEKLPIIGDFTGPFAEKVVALRPDLVIIQGETYDAARVENWQRKIGAPVAALVPTDIEKVAGGIEKLGAWLDAKEEAQKLYKGFKPYIGGDRGLEGEPKAFFEVERSPLWTAGKDTLIYSVMGRAGISNIAFSMSGYKPYNIETLISKDPDLYIVPEAKPDKERVLQRLRKDPVLRQLRCVQTGNVVAIPADWVLRPGPRLLKGLEELMLVASKIEPKTYP